MSNSEEMKEGEMNYSLLLESIILRITGPSVGVTDLHN